MAVRLYAIESSRDQAITQATLLERDLDIERSRALEAINNNAKLSTELAAINAVLERKSTSLQTLESRVAELERRNGST